jgi:hypothetical protein
MGASDADTKSKRPKPKRKQTKRSGKTKEDEHASTAKVYSNLLSILERCYNQRSETPPDNSKTETKKRKEPPTKGSARKRRKTNEGTAEDVETGETSTNQEAMLSK